MKVEQIMTSAPLVCRPHATAADAARLMWEGDCGIVPIVDDQERVVGIVTDRDICMASWSTNRPPSSIAVSELARGPVLTCRPDDDVRTALDTMQDRGVRRLPVTGGDGRIKGVLSFNDVVLAAGHGTGVTAADVLEALKGVCGHRDLPATI